MGERPDQVCQMCLSNVASDDAWVVSGWRVYHKRCFRCQQCKRAMTDADRGRGNDARIVCRKCSGDGVASSSFDTGARAVVAAQPLLNCHRCGRAITNKTTGGTSNAGNRYCEECFMCLNCRCDPLCGGTRKAMFELLDEIFCVECELAYRNRRYLLQRLMAGPSVSL